ncbi:hemagglutinin repeat-containing protein [Pseudomonas syringae]|uniref:hemagglutinin repeat-containing protein n=1 Tax=Pseudomonas syringae TaxID=317 RepID=UPI000736121A|nr:hypothetical protein AO070_23225 [Pseudomonas syringae pv. syringae PD2766]
MTTDVKNLASTVVAGGNVSIDAAHDVNFLASQPKAGNNLTINAGRTFKTSHPPVSPIPAKSRISSSLHA